MLIIRIIVFGSLNKGGSIVRYYCFVLNIGADQIKKNAKINLREYAYENTLAAMNNYMFKNMKNDLCFFAYREEENVTFAVFSYSEKKISFHDAYDYIIEILNDVFLIKKIKVDPYEITMFECLEYLLEARRREYANISNRLIEASNLWVYNYYNNEPKTFHFDFKEHIISEKERKKNLIYDQKFVNELSNIEAHENVSEHSGNMVHYIISSRSTEAASDMTETLMQSLLKANRISSRRMEIISEIEPDIFKINNHLEEIIENNYGGVIVFDLSEKFGYDPVDYAMAGKYLEKLLKKYRNHCLFVFTYNMENPGFSYFVLPQIKKYVVPVMLLEGTGDRKAAVNYMKELIKG